jgi:hypothetical protein
MTIPHYDSESASSPWGETIAIVATASATCAHCSTPFAPHRGKRFCTSKCRVAFHNAKRISETPPETPQPFQ